MKKPQLSIVVLTCSQCGFTMRLLDSMLPYLRQRGDAVELVLVDNGSTDDTLHRVSDWTAAHGVANLRVIRAGENLGVARGRNLGLSHAHGSVLMLLDNDTLADGRVFDLLLEHVSRHPECGIAAPALYSPQGGLQASAKPYPGLWLKICHVLRPGRELACERRELASPHPFYVIGACQMFRREMLEKAGMLDEKIFFGPEDADFCMRVRRAGYTVDYLPHLHLIHDWQRATRRSPLGRLGRLHARALMRFWWRTGFGLLT